MGNKPIARGIYPTMITPFDSGHRIDEEALRRMMQFYLESGVQGVFAVCQSSEMFYLTLKERVQLARAVVRLNEELSAGMGRAPLCVVASGHISEALEDQLEEAKQIYDTGIDAFVLVSNRMDLDRQGDDAFKRHTEALLAGTQDMPLGIYECPYPYKRLLSPALARWCADTGRFLFLKDTCCSLPALKEKIAALKGTDMGLFNANAQTLLPSLELGAAGFSGVMANFHPDLYARLYQLFCQGDARAQALQDFIGFAALSEKSAYPVTAKYHMNLVGVPMELVTRTRPASDLDEQAKIETRALITLENQVRRLLA